MFVLLTLLVCEQASAASVGNQSAYTKQAYHVYDMLTKRGWNPQDGEKPCRNLFNFAIEAVNRNLEKHERPDYVILCRIKPSVVGFFSFASCSSTTDGGRLPKTEYEVEASKGFTWQ